MTEELVESLHEQWNSVTNGEWIGPTIEIFIVLIGGLMVLGILSRGVSMLCRQLKVDPLAVRPIRFVVRWFGFVLIIAMVLGRFGVDLLTVLSAVIAMVAIGFVAVWSVLSHLSSTVLLILARPFSVEDHIEFPGEDIKGRVVDLSPFYTTLEDEHGAFYQIPNNLFFQKTVRRVRGRGKIGLGEQLSAKKPATVSELPSELQMPSTEL